MNNMYLLFTLIGLVGSILGLFGIRIAYKYYRSNKINYSNSKMALHALAEYDKSLALYMKTQYADEKRTIDLEMVLFEEVIGLFQKKFKGGK